MIHLTLNTGHVSDVADPAPEAVRAVSALAIDGGGAIGDIAPAFRGYRVAFCARPWNGSVSWDVSHESPSIRAPLALCVLAAEDRAAVYAWQAIEKTYLALTDRDARLYAPLAMPPMPDRAPWLATVLMPGIYLHADAAEWLADFDQCLAFAALPMATARRATP